MRLRSLLLMFAVASALVAGAPVALATHCNGQPHPPAVPDDYPCSTPVPPTPKPTPTPAPTPTVAPTKAPAPRTFTRRSTPLPTLVPLDIQSTPEATIQVPGPAFNDLEEQPLETENSASATTWIVAFIIGFLIGALVGRASWGFGRRKRRQQIFG